MEKDGKEKQILYAWGIEKNQLYHFRQIDEMGKSYFIKRQIGFYIEEYDFETVPQLMEKLDSLWHDDQMMEPMKKVIGVAAIKNKPTVIKNLKLNKDNRDKAEDELPAYIYNF